MAIKSKETKIQVSIPAQLDDLAQKGFTFQQLSSIYEEKFKETKGDLEDYLSKTKEIEVTDGKSIDTPYGKICYQGNARPSYEYNTDKLVALIERGDVTLDQILACVSSFKTEDLQKTIGKKFDEVATLKPSKPSIRFTATPEFKSEMKEKFGETLDGVATIAKEVKTIESKKPDSEKVKKAIATAKKLVKKAKKDVNAELEDILKEK